MVLSTLRVEITHVSDAKSVYYGNTSLRKVIEETLYRDHDNRKKEIIAPCGVLATIAINRNSFDLNVLQPLLNDNKVSCVDVFTINVNKTYLDYEDENSFVAFFHVDERVYELYVKFKSKNAIDDIWLSEWLNNADFEDGVNADNVYKKDSFSTYSTIF